MRVAIFTDNDFEKVNGVTTTLRATLRHAPPGMRMRVYTASRVGAADEQYLSFQAPGMPIPLYPEMRFYLPPVAALRRAVVEDGADVIHLTTPGPVGLAAMRIARQLSLPLVGSFHTDLAAYARLLSGWDGLGTLTGALLRWPYGRCARVLAPSEATRQLLMRGPADEARIDIWRRGVDGAQFHPARRNSALRDAWGASESRPVLLYVGRVSREKGLHLLPGISRALVADGLDHQVVVVGQGPMLAELRGELPGAVFTGTLHGDALAEAYASADVFVFPSRTDTAGNVVLEAQASGLPVVVSSIGGPCENLNNGRSGHVVVDHTAEAWAARIAPLVVHGGYRRAMAREARLYAESRTWARALAPLFHTYRDVVAARAVGAIGPRPRGMAPGPVSA